MEEGWLLLFLTLAVVATIVGFALRAHLRPQLEASAPPQRRTAPRPHPPRSAPKVRHLAPRTAPATSLSTTTPAPRAEWLPDLVDAVALLFTGGQRSGKTVLNHHIATTRARRGELVKVADVDARPGMWPGCTVVGGGDRYPEIDALLAEVADEGAHRRRLRAQGQRQFRPMTLVICELGDVIRECPAARQLVEDLWRRGGKLRIHTLYDVQDAQVRTLDLGGASKLLVNVQLVEVRRFGAQRLASINGVEHVIPRLVDPEALADQYAAAHPAEIAALAEQPAAPATAAPQLQWTVEHVRVAAWLAEAAPQIRSSSPAARLLPMPALPC